MVRSCDHDPKVTNKQAMRIWKRESVTSGRGDIYFEVTCTLAILFNALSWYVFWALPFRTENRILFCLLLHFQTATILCRLFSLQFRLIFRHFTAIATTTPRSNCTAKRERTTPCTQQWEWLSPTSHTDTDRMHQESRPSRQRAAVDTPIRVDYRRRLGRKKSMFVWKDSGVGTEQRPSVSEWDSTSYKYTTKKDYVQHTHGTASFRVLPGFRFG